MKATKNTITEENKAFIKKNRMKLTVKEISKEINVTTGTVQGFLHRNGLEYKYGKTGASNRLSQSEVDYIQEHQQTKTHPQMAKELGITRKVQTDKNKDRS